MIFMPDRYVSLSREVDQALASTLRDVLLYVVIFRFFAFRATDLWFGIDTADLDGSSDAGSAFNQLILPAMFLAVCAVVHLFRIPVRRLLAALLPAAPLLLMIALSPTWSDYPELTIRRASHELIEALSLALLATTFSNATVMLRIFFRAFLAIGCLDLMSSVMFSQSFTDLGFAGIHGHKNVAGQFLMVALPIYLQGTLFKEISGSRLLGLLSFALGITMLVATQSKTSVGAIVVGLSAVLLTRGLSRRTIPGPLLLVLLLGILCSLAALIHWGPDELLEALIGDPTLTGRDQIWRYAVNKFNANPVVGTGYGAIWQIGPAIQLALRSMGLYLVFNEAHNGYLEIAAQLGIAGLLCLLIFLVATLLNSLSYWAAIEKRSYRGVGAYTIYIFWGLALANITESIYFQAGIGGSGILIFLGAFAASRNKQSPATGRHRTRRGPAREIAEPAAKFS